MILELLDDIGPNAEIALSLCCLDDGLFVGQCSSLASFLNLLSTKGPSYGLHINLSKCEVFWSGSDSLFPEFPANIQRVQKNSGIEFLGVPIVGPDDYFDACIAKRVDKIFSCQDHLSDLGDPQIELHLLCSCLSLCKINYLLRTVPFSRLKSQLVRFDQGLRSCLETIARSSLSDMAWNQATLPIRLGGRLGLREACRTAPAAFLGSCNSSHTLFTPLQYLVLLSHQWQAKILDLSLCQSILWKQ